MKFLLAFLSLSIFYFSSSVRSNDLYESCNTCTATNQYYQKMQDAVLPQVDINGYQGKVVVANFKRGVAYAWDVRAYYRMAPEAIEPSIEFQASVSAVPIDIQNAVLEISQHEIMQMASSVVHVDVDSGFTNAWEIARNPSSREALDDWFQEAYPIAYWRLWVSSNLGGMFFDFLDGTEYIFRFANGDEVTLVAPSASSARQRFSYKRNSAVDRFRNEIADAGTSVDGTYVFDGQQSLQNFLDLAASYGIEIRVISGGGCGPSCYRITITDLK